ncbi:hypothetical protein CQW23_15462 [Capsicum baccatum]|uniref:DNA-directed RNA polymerase n=1 Tax=Capsicum baccatum TaxID=33114 RepID=A0A2G2WM34_CAPBA|nr:hypothetical protein CQW23_15462 [Capsicum baccatum]
MSYFLLDEDMAKSTNLLPFQDKKIQDVYTNILSELKNDIVRELGNNSSLSLLVVWKMDRKLVKSIFMPIIYGKILMSTSSDIHKTLSQHNNFKDNHLLASLCFKFWKEKCKSMDNLTIHSLIRNIGWFAAAKGLPVYYVVLYFCTSQDYMKSDVVKITVYKCNHKKRQISLRVPTDNSDRRKTEVSTFVNFIHQKDAYIAMLGVEKMLRVGGSIYTIHDNFLTTPHYSCELPPLYGEALLELGPPLVIINDMMHANLIRGAEGSLPADLRYFDFSERVIPIGEMKNYLKNNIPDGFDLENPDVTITVGYAIRLYGDNGKLLPGTVYGDIVSTLSEFARKYEKSGIVRITLRVYSMDEKVVGVTPSIEDIVPLLEEVIRRDFPINSAKCIHVDDIRHDERSYSPAPHMMTVKKGERKVERKAFVVADLETLITSEGDTHKSYAAGLMLVLPKDPVKYNRVETYFNDDYITIKYFDDRSSKMMDDFFPELSIYLRGLGQF